MKIRSAHSSAGLIAVIMLISSAAAAEEPLFYSREATGDAHMCSLKASVFEAAATARDNNGTPALARQMTAAYKEVPNRYREVAIKNVFENPKFNVSGRELYRIFLNDCLYGSATPNK